MDLFEGVTGAPPLSKLLKESPEKLKLTVMLVREIRLLMAEATRGGFKPELASEAFKLLRDALTTSTEHLQLVTTLIKEMRELVKVVGKTGIAPEKILEQLKQSK